MKKHRKITMSTVLILCGQLMFNRWLFPNWINFLFHFHFCVNVPLFLAVDDSSICCFTAFFFAFKMIFISIVITKLSVCATSNFVDAILMQWHNNMLYLLPKKQFNLKRTFQLNIGRWFFGFRWQIKFEIGAITLRDAIEYDEMTMRKRQRKRTKKKIVDSM